MVWRHRDGQVPSVTLAVRPGDLASLTLRFNLPSSKIFYPVLTEFAKSIRIDLTLGTNNFAGFDAGRVTSEPLSGVAGGRTSLCPQRRDVRRTEGPLPASRSGGDGISSPGFSFPQLSGVSLTPADWKINLTRPPWGTQPLGQRLHKNVPQRGHGPGPCPCSSTPWGPVTPTRTSRKAASGLGGPGAADGGGRHGSRGPRGGADPVSHFSLVPEALGPSGLATQGSGLTVEGGTGGTALPLRDVSRDGPAEQQTGSEPGVWSCLSPCHTPPKLGCWDSSSQPGATRF